MTSANPVQELSNNIAAPPTCGMLSLPHTQHARAHVHTHTHHAPGTYLCYLRGTGWKQLCLPSFQRYINSEPPSLSLEGGCCRFDEVTDFKLTSTGFQMQLYLIYNIFFFLNYFFKEDWKLPLKGISRKVWGGYIFSDPILIWCSHYYSILAYSEINFLYRSSVQLQYKINQTQ